MNWTKLDRSGDTPQIRNRPPSVRDVVHVARAIPWDGELPDGPLHIYRKWGLEDEQIWQALEYYLSNPSRVDVDHIDGDVKRIKCILHRLDAD